MIQPSTLDFYSIFPRIMPNFKRRLHTMKHGEVIAPITLVVILVFMRWHPTFYLQIFYSMGFLKFANLVDGFWRYDVPRWQWTRAGLVGLRYSLLAKNISNLMNYIS